VSIISNQTITESTSTNYFGIDFNPVNGSIAMGSCGNYFVEIRY
jgi:hypothetical protein